MRRIKLIEPLRKQLTSVRTSGAKIGLVPTMGNLHSGHLSLIKAAQEAADHVVVSIFVNPTQFGTGEDFNDYPRTLTADLNLLRELNVDTVFVPDNMEMYNQGTPATEVTVPALDSMHCGSSRPGHFKGVATVVTKLFNIVQPNFAVFGEKDYQQLLIIRNLTQSLNFPIEIIAMPTVREADGLAISSRNSYLTAKERQQAPGLYRCLCNTSEAIKQGDRNYKKLESQAFIFLKNHEFRVDYFIICDAKTLQPPNTKDLVILAATWLGKPRLIDNISVHIYD